MKTAVIGSTGYGGAELIRLIEGHPHLELAMLISTSQAGDALSQSYPHLRHLAYTFQELDIAQIGQEAELVFLATPPGVSGELTPQLRAQGKLVIDLSGDFRLKDGRSYEDWYNRKAAPDKWLAEAVYGLPEWFAEEIRTADLIANPGCYPTATLLGLLPLLQHRMIDHRALVIDAKSGVTGAGRKVDQSLLFSEVNENLRPYKVDGHQHIPEIEQAAKRLAGAEVRVRFVPHLVPMNRGILVSLYAPMLHKYTTTEVLHMYEEVYEDAPFVRIVESGWPSTKAVQGSNFCDIGVHVDERTGWITVLSVIDNLMKGAAGQAVQNANLRMGWAATAGLMQSPLFP
ncbi:N-acetyl-gamma-glutamyl-phosphate reductase [Laceyella sediminis]|uniref:N-acetyl-gamma-glutamyl-phosphate reductase n=1 Tax=Laceyella sediminis TaxID=573074 RepID=A0ABX5ERT0_9BACL|nr:N-acetyl-gamma-glutamyl-phosphate reductase [Laceyella sediminis]PRZ16442.1 N-acetyl-gamma-glutamyl-phosphate reductase [Laceyella sediminis]